MSIYDKLRVKRADLGDTQARLQQLEAEIEGLAGGPGFAETKARLMQQVRQLHQQADRIQADILFLTTELQPRLL